MQTLEFNVSLAEASDKAELAEIADHIRAALAEEADITDPAAVPVRSGRGMAEVVAIVAVALTVASDIDKGLKAVESMIARFQKLFAGSKKKSEQILAGLDASSILINVDGVLVPLDKLTEEHLKWLRSQ
jgi:hypothetical protein